MPRVKRSGAWVVIVSDDDTGQHITTRRVYARTADKAADKVCEWLDSEGFDFTARLEVGPDAEPND